MLDHSFSSESFRRILESNNHKGVYLEHKFFPRLKAIDRRIKEAKEYLRIRPKHFTDARYLTLKEKALERLKRLVEERDSLLNKELLEVSQKIHDPKYKVPLVSSTGSDGKRIYKADGTPTSYFALKQLQIVLRDSCQLKHANRFAIVSQLARLLGDGFPKIIVRVDIRDFYESIPLDNLIRKINVGNFLTFTCKKILSRMLSDYREISGKAGGIPRGISISPDLAEIFMADFDTRINALRCVSYYARYVDDILLIITPDIALAENKELKALIHDLKNVFCLDRNKKKTRIIKFLDPMKNFSIEYLGYKFEVTKNGVKLTFPDSKVEKIKTRIDLILDSYVSQQKYDEKAARKLLVNRLSFSTGNTRLLNNKKHVLTGIYFSNSLLTETDVLDELDLYLEAAINEKITSLRLRSRLKKYRFLTGFTEKRFSSFTTDELTDIVRIWR